MSKKKINSMKLKAELLSKTDTDPEDKIKGISVANWK